MTWLRRYRLREFLRSSFGAAPAASLVCAVLVARFLRGVDARLHWQCFGFTADGAKLILDAFAGSMLTFVVVVVSSLLLVVQLASAQLTPRIIAPVFRHPMVRLGLSIFVFAYVLAIAVLARIDQNVPQLTLAIAVGMNTLSLIFFLFFVGALGMRLRPAHVLAITAKGTRGVIFDVYPTLHDAASPECAADEALAKLPAPPTVVEHSGASGALLAFDADGLVQYARQLQAVIQICPRVGDFVAGGEPMFQIYGAAAIDRKRLRSMVALGAERTIEQDPSFGFRIVVDIACKALSPAINDPTTATLAIDQLDRMLRWVGGRHLHSGILSDSTHAIRVVFPTPSWEQYVWLAVSEIRHYGRDSIQACRRVCLMLNHLIAILPESRHPPLREQLRMLHASVERNFPDQEDREQILQTAAWTEGRNR